MREIQFRGKDDDGVWRYGYLVELAGEGLCIAETPLSANRYGEIYKQDYSPIAPETVGQYTGLCDKNGERIYEGDVVLCPVCRHGDGQSWYSTRNKNHGCNSFFAHAIVTWRDGNGYIRGDGWTLKETEQTRNEIEEIERPVGHERKRQHAYIAFGSLDHDAAAMCEVVGDIYGAEPPALVGRDAVG